MTSHLDIDDVTADHPIARLELERLKQAAQRYETARRLNPKQWTAAWHKSLTTWKPFDDIIDDITAQNRRQQKQ